MSRLSGRDPLSIAPGGIGTGAAQVFDFQPFDPTEKIADAAIANAQRKQKAQAKVQEEYQNKINLFRKELDGWQDRDGEVLNKLTEDIINEGARIAAKGIDPTTLPDYRKQMEKAVLLGKKSKQDKEFYDNAFKVAMEKSKSPIYSQEDIDFDLKNLEQFATNPLLERQQFQIPLKAKEVPIDWNKGFQSLINNTKLDLTQIEADDVTITNENVPKERIEANWKNYTATNPYKEQVKVYMSEFGLSEEEAATEAKRNYVASLPTKYKKAFDENYGGIKVNYGGNAISSDGVTAFYNPNAYNTAKDRSNIDYDAIRAFEQKPDPAEGSLGNRIVSAEGAIMFKPSKGRQEIGYRETALENGRLMLFRPNAIYKTDTGYVAFGRKRVEETTKDGRKIVSEMPTYIKIGNNNRIEIENTWLGGEDIDAAFENFKSQRKSTPQSTAVKPKAETNTPKTNKKPKPY